MGKNLKRIGESLTDFAIFHLKPIVAGTGVFLFGFTLGVIVGVKSGSLIQLGVGSTFTNQNRTYYSVDRESVENAIKRDNQPKD